MNDAGAWTSALAQRLIDLGREAGGLGWGYGDFVTEIVGEIQQQFGDV